MKAKFTGKCFGGNDAVQVGDEIVSDRGRWSHPQHRGLNAGSGARLARDINRIDSGYGRSDPDNAYNRWYGPDWTSADEQEYQQGLADGRRYQAEKRAYGPALAEQFAIEDDFNRYWKYGEDY